MKENWTRKPLAYFITFSTYGTWLHGTDKGSVDKQHNQYGSELLSPNKSRETYEKKYLKNAPIVLNKRHRMHILLSIKEVCAYRQWELHAAHVRSNHVHVIVSARVTPERILKDLKAYATRTLRKINHSFRDIKIWTHHGSTKYIWTHKSLNATLHYVIYEQGMPMEWWCQYDIQSHECK